MMNFGAVPCGVAFGFSTRLDSLRADRSLKAGDCDSMNAPGHMDKPGMGMQDTDEASHGLAHRRRSLKKMLLVGAMLVLLLIIALSVAVGGPGNLSDFAVRSLYTLLGRGPVVVVDNQTGAPALDVTVRFDGGSARWDSLSSAEVVKQALWLRGESALSVSWRDAEGREAVWDLDCYLESSWYERVTITLQPDGGVAASDTYGALKAAPAPLARVVQ